MSEGNKRELEKKWSHIDSPLGKEKNKLLFKLNNKTITHTEEIKLNNLTIMYLNDLLKMMSAHGKDDPRSLDILIKNIFNLKKENSILEEKIRLKGLKKITRIKHLRKRK